MRRMVKNEVSYSRIIFSQISIEENISGRSFKKGKGRLFLDVIFKGSTLLNFIPLNLIGPCWKGVRCTFQLLLEVA